MLRQTAWGQPEWLLRVAKGHGEESCEQERRCRCEGRGKRQVAGCPVESRGDTDKDVVTGVRGHEMAVRGDVSGARVCLGHRHNKTPTVRVARGQVRTGGVETQWTMPKPARKGTYHAFGEKYLGGYLRTFEAHHNFR